ncbi:hypothetical protein DPEC_G00276690 [Dallia pectoralis]|uniref:Uncharacterized protein n=1 Tax=Dallia pectoralis TaxID=75939 RepID=A0ACC2FLQ6_DALPE|nr:hypothetical protein DPEC_G00276690 [Dallia pectoralis]
MTGLRYIRLARRWKSHARRPDCASSSDPGREPGGGASAQGPGERPSAAFCPRPGSLARLNDPPYRPGPEESLSPVADDSDDSHPLNPACLVSRSGAD